ncbi:MAG: 4Fe-4S dicluster domain-containing protein [Phycisphaerae bacterium]|nr:4Fe-4S dicluster domain-containing protein [Phycisphaerae bacterium]
MPEDPNLSRRDLLRGRLFGRLVQSASNKLDAVGTAITNASASPVKSTRANAPVAGGGNGESGGRTGIGRRFTLPIHRPPGAVDEVSFLSGCTRCNDCISACPVSAIVHAPARFREAAGTPMIDPHTSPCIMCEDTPCITACKPSVLRVDQPRKMGVAWIQTMACLAHTGSFCTVCSERCPVPNAIEVDAGKPTIRADVCTGCGVCASVCPAPTNAIVVMPMADRPAGDGAQNAK